MKSESSDNQNYIYLLYVVSFLGGSKKIWLLKKHFFYFCCCSALKNPEQINWVYMRSRREQESFMCQTEAESIHIFCQGHEKVTTCEMRAFKRVQSRCRDFVANLFQWSVILLLPFRCGQVGMQVVWLWDRLLLKKSDTLSKWLVRKGCTIGRVI